MKNGLQFIIIFGIVVLAMGGNAYAQQSDTSSTTKVLQPEEAVIQRYHSDRSVGNLFMPQTGMQRVPEPKQYYVHPFMAQKQLEMALADYYNELTEEKSLLYQFISTIAPYVNNQFEFAVYRIYDLPIVERDQPMLEPQLIEKQKNDK